MTRFIPGKPTIIVQNMPGAGTAKAAEYIYAHRAQGRHRVRHDFPRHIARAADRARQIPLRSTKFAYVGNADIGVRTCITYKTSKVKTFKDALTSRPFSVARNPARRSPTMLRWSSIWRGRIQDRQWLPLDAADRARHGARGGRWHVRHRPVLGACDAGGLGRHRRDQRARADVAGAEPGSAEAGFPSLWDFVDGDNRKAAEIIIAQQEFQRPFIAPPEIPAERLAILRKAFMEALADREALAEADKMGLTIVRRMARLSRRWSSTLCVSA